MKIYLLLAVVVLCVSLSADLADGNPQHHKKGVFHRLKHSEYFMTDTLSTIRCTEIIKATFSEDQMLQLG